MTINKELDSLAKYELVCFENEKSFLLRFASAQAWQLVKVSFSSEVIYFTYVLYSGQHIANSCKREDFINWYLNN